MHADLIAGRYRVLRAVGRGGMGAVWLCRDEVLLREVALKQIEGLEDGPASKAARPLREARVAAALNHENAVSMFERLAASGEIAPVAPVHLYYLLTGAGASVFVMAPECQRLAGVDPFAPEFVAAHADLVVDLLIRTTTKESS